MRDSQHIAEAVRSVAAPIVRALSLELVDVECSGQGARTVVRVFIDKPGGVSVGDCEQVHLSLGHALDVEDPIPHGYTLEVSSPGLDRPLKQRADYERSQGKRVRVRLRTPVNGQWRILGTLAGISETGVTLADTVPPSDSAIQIEWGAIVETRLEVEF